MSSRGVKYEIHDKEVYVAVPSLPSMLPNCSQVSVNHFEIAQKLVQPTGTVKHTSFCQALYVTVCIVRKQRRRRRSIGRRLRSKGCGRGNRLKESSLCQRSVDPITRHGASSDKASHGCESVNHLPAYSPQVVCGGIVMSAPPAGLEPATCGLGNRCSIH